MKHRLEVVEQRGLGRGRGFETRRYEDDDGKEGNYVRAMTMSMMAALIDMSGERVYTKAELEEESERAFAEGVKVGRSGRVGKGRVMFRPSFVIRPEVKA